MFCSGLEPLGHFSGRSLSFFAQISQFFEVLGAGAGRAPEPAQSENLEDFGRDFCDFGKILLILEGNSKDFQTFS